MTGSPTTPTSGGSYRRDGKKLILVSRTGQKDQEKGKRPTGREKTETAPAKSKTEKGD